MHSYGLPPSAPPVLSTVRIATLLTSLLVSLGSGTNYVFSARLHLSHTQQNIVGLAGNIGVYSTSPFWGRIVDTKGPKPLLALAFVSLLIGYSGIRHFYIAGLPEGASDLSMLTFWVLVLCSFLTGIGGNGGLSSVMNATVKSFPEGARATVTGLVISGFGLSAFLFSSIAHLIFPGNTSDFLLLLAVGTSLPMVLGFFVVRPIPLPQSDYAHVPDDMDDSDEEIFSVETPPAYRREHSRTNLLNGQNRAEAYMDNDDMPDETQHRRSASRFAVPIESGLALNPTRSGSHQRSISSPAVSRLSGKTYDGQPNISGIALLSSNMFWLLFIIMSLLSGTGLMYINNVGSISQALFAKGNPEFDEKKASQWQATQVSTVSVANCMGRVIIGLVADFTKNRLHYPRSFCIVLVAFMFIISQLTVFNIDNIEDLWKGSALLGLSYGGMFGLFPTIVVEWFGLAHFSENWGFVSLSPLFGGNIFSIAFGRNLDAHAPSGPQDTILNTDMTPIDTALNARANSALDASHQCLLGRECYASSLFMTIAACTLALCLSVYAGWKDYRESKRPDREHHYSQPVVVWEGAED